MFHSQHTSCEASVTVIEVLKVLHAKSNVLLTVRAALKLLPVALLVTVLSCTDGTDE